MVLNNEGVLVRRKDVWIPRCVRSRDILMPWDEYLETVSNNSAAEEAEREAQYSNLEASIEAAQDLAERLTLLGLGTNPRNRRSIELGHEDLLYCRVQGVTLNPSQEAPGTVIVEMNFSTLEQILDYMAAHEQGRAMAEIRGGVSS
jgi:hypothetical protein